jgi:chemotaxis protein methyltransferase CheR
MSRGSFCLAAKATAAESISEARLEEISKLVGASNLPALCEQAKKGIEGSFKQLLLDVSTNNETYFFRDPNVFKAIEATVLPKLADLQQPLRIWSAASSHGQEALSLAMMISEWNVKHKTSLSFSILGSDVSERALERAKKAEYTQLEIQRGLPAPLMIKYFAKDDQDRWTAKESLTQHTKFKSLNLLTPFSFPEKFNLILCRNVLIYQTVERKIQILEKISEALAPGGYLVLGSAETLLGLSNTFQHAHTDGAIIYRKSNQAEVKAA